MPAAPVSFQNVRLSRGAHTSPREGACVMEVVSMLAGEHFSDRPRTACPVIGAFLRAYNDIARDAQRNELLACASRVVGSRRPEAQALRIRHCLHVALELHERQPRWRRLTPADWRLRPDWLAAGPVEQIPLDRLGSCLARLLHHTPGGPVRAVALVEELVAIGDPDPRYWSSTDATPPSTASPATVHAT